jgi:hypothetical protein
MSTVNFGPLFEYLDDKFGKVDLRFDRVEERINVLTNAVDSALKQGKDNAEEITTINHRLDGHDARLEKVESTVGMEYQH